MQDVEESSAIQTAVNLGVACTVAVAVLFSDIETINVLMTQ